jgi:hypothetical protein
VTCLYPFINNNLNLLQVRTTCDTCKETYCKNHLRATCDTCSGLLFIMDDEPVPEEDLVQEVLVQVVDQPAPAAQPHRRREEPVMPVTPVAPVTPAAPTTPVTPVTPSADGNFQFILMQTMQQQMIQLQQQFNAVQQQHFNAVQQQQGRNEASPSISYTPTSSRSRHPRSGESEGEL